METVLEELADLLKESASSTDQELSADDVVSPEDEYCTEAPDGEASESGES